MTLTYPEYFQKIACLSAYPEPKILKNIKGKKKFSILDFYFSWNRRRRNSIRMGRKAADFLYELGAFFHFQRIHERTWRESKKLHGFN